MKHLPIRIATRVGAVAVLVWAMGLPTQAAVTYTWTGAADSSWQTAGNWAAPGQPPWGGTTTSADRLNVQNGANHPLVYTSAEGTTTLDRLVCGTTGQAGAVTISGGSLVTASTGDIVGNNFGAGTLTINDGAYTTTSTLTLNNSANANAVFTINGGTATMSSLNLKSGNGTGSAANLNGGTLVLGSVVQGGGVLSDTNRVFNFDGGVLKTKAALSSFVVATANVRDGGAIIDSNGYNSTIGKGLTHSVIAGDNATDGGLTKNGAGTLTLSGTNTYTGATTVNAGTLTLTSTSELRFRLGDAGACNRVKGTGTVNFNGLFRLERGALAASGGTWQLVDVGTLTESFHATTFAVALVGGPAFANRGGGRYTSGEWTFRTTTGVLTRTPAGTAIVLR